MCAVHCDCIEKSQSVFTVRCRCLHADSMDSGQQMQPCKQEKKQVLAQWIHRVKQWTSITMQCAQELDTTAEGIMSRTSVRYLRHHLEDLLVQLDAIHGQFQVYQSAWPCTRQKAACYSANSWCLFDKQCFVICCMSSAISMSCYFHVRNTAKGGLVCTIQSCVSMEHCRSGQAYTTFRHTIVMLTSVTVQVCMDAMQCRERTRVKSEGM